MVNDKEVKTAVSPFAAREDEKKVYDGKEGFASINQIVFKMESTRSSKRIWICYFKTSNSNLRIKRKVK